MFRVLTAVVAAALVAGACTGEDPNLTEAGKGRPILSVAFPERTQPNSVHDAVLTVENPGPGDMRTVVVAFAPIGPSAGQTEFPVAIVGFGPQGTDAVTGVRPEPTGVSEHGVVYTFGPRCPDGGGYPDDCGGAAESDVLPRLAEGETLTLTFSLRVPNQAGPAANSVQVYDGAEIDRARGVRMETLVGR
jgi:hypothetical protein